MRKVFWNIYAWPITLLFLFVYSDLLNGFRLPLAMDMLLSIPAIMALHFHIWGKNVFSVVFWKIYMYIFFIWEILFNFIIDPYIKQKEFDPSVLIMPIVFIPLYVGLVRYANRN